MSTTPERPADRPARVRSTIIVLSVGMGLLLLFAYAAETLFDRAPGGAFFFVVPVIGFLIPMLLSALSVPRERRGLVVGLALASAAVAAATLVVSAIFEWTHWLPWIAGTVATVALGLGAALGAGDAVPRTEVAD